jgi:hypothetical protein
VQYFSRRCSFMEYGQLLGIISDQSQTTALFFPTFCDRRPLSPAECTFEYVALLNIIQMYHIINIQSALDGNELEF